jgi:NAD(P)-dependent dehydrogenase (short-subunit alcohol dehydrogenase family)
MTDPRLGGSRVNSVCPSIVDTPMAHRGMGVESFEGVPFPVDTPDDVAWAVLFFLLRCRERSMAPHS